MAGTVTIACKLPHGLVLRTFAMTKVQQPVMGGGYREVDEARASSTSVTVNGPASPFGEPNENPVSAGFALTHGVDADIWKQWLAQNHDSDIVKNGLIFAHEKTETVVAQTKENRTRRTGLEPLNPAVPHMVDAKKMPAGITPATG